MPKQSKYHKGFANKSPVERRKRIVKKDRRKSWPVRIPDETLIKLDQENKSIKEISEITEYHPSTVSGRFKKLNVTVSTMRRSETREKNIVKSAKEGKTRPEIAAITGISYDYACERIKTLGLTVKRKPQRKRTKVPDAIFIKLTKEGKTKPEIAEITGLAVATVGKRMLSIGLVREKRHKKPNDDIIQLAKEGKLKHDIEEFKKLDLKMKPFHSKKSSAIIYAAIIHMKAEKYTMEEIGKELGMFKQAVWERLKRIEN